MLLWPDELTWPDRVRLDRHLERCADCRLAASRYADNRARLLLLAQLRPPEELRIAVSEVAARSQEALAFYLPLAFAFLAVPLSLLIVALLFAYRLPALLGLLTGIGLLSLLTVWRTRRGVLTQEQPTERDVESICQVLLRGLLPDLAGTAIGALLAVALFALLAFLSGWLQ